jgi:hypothetical protein
MTTATVPAASHAQGRTAGDNLRQRATISPVARPSCDLAVATGKPPARAFGQAIANACRRRRPALPEWTSEWAGLFRPGHGSLRPDPVGLRASHLQGRLGLEERAREPQAGHEGAACAHRRGSRAHPRRHAQAAHRGHGRRACRCLVDDELGRRDQFPRRISHGG